MLRVVKNFRRLSQPGILFMMVGVPNESVNGIDAP